MHTNHGFFDKLLLPPIAFFGIPMGLGALSIAWYRAENVFLVSHYVSTALGLGAFAIWLFLFILYVCKAVSSPKHFLGELHYSARLSLPVLILIGAMVVGEIWVLWGYVNIGQAFIIASILLQLSYNVWQIGSLWRGDTFTQNTTLPHFYLPTIAGNFISANALALLGYKDLALLFFGAGMFAWMMFEPVLLQHIRTQSVVKELRATFGIILAPAFVGASAYISVVGTVDIFVKMLFGYGILQLLFLLRLLPWIAKGGVGPSFWSFSFGLASMANVSVLLYQHQSLYFLDMVLFAFANMVILILMGISIRAYR
ncbi:dicarboxylate transporter/tellurite-resistance protein TehA [Moraxella sp. ZY200743]|uniref:SLAC1 family transporter n=1 Tax=Moraxella sp. ZY200743 TaxID=2911970 RepID=UPI003D7D61D2